MKHISELAHILKEEFSIDKRRSDCLAGMVCSIVRLRTVNMKQLSMSMGHEVKVESTYRRLQRLMSGLEIDMLKLTLWLLSWFYSTKEKIWLTIDRTNWQWGKQNINYLVIAVPYKRMAIPLIWVPLSKKGNSSREECIALLEQLFTLFPVKRIKGIIGDREFIGEKWFCWLAKRNLPFFIRIKDNAIAGHAEGWSVEVKALFSDLRPGCRRKLKGLWRIYGCEVYLTGSRLVSGELMVIASITNKDCAINCYKERWEIEVLFQNLKSRGFDMESTHLTAPEKLHRLMGILAISACWAYRVGVWRIDQGELLRKKKHGRYEKSLFRHGLDKLQSLLLKPFRWKEWKPLIALWKELASPAM